MYAVHTKTIPGVCDVSTLNRKNDGERRSATLFEIALLVCPLIAVAIVGYFMARTHEWSLSTAGIFTLASLIVIPVIWHFCRSTIGRMPRTKQDEETRRQELRR